MTSWVTMLRRAAITWSESILATEVIICFSSSGLQGNLVLVDRKTAFYRTGGNLLKNGGDGGARTRDLRRDRPAF